MDGHRSFFAFGASLQDQQKKQQQQRAMQFFTHGKDELATAAITCCMRAMEHVAAASFNPAEHQVRLH